MVIKDRITDEQYQQALEAFKNLNDRANNSQEQKADEEEERKREKEFENNQKQFSTTK